MFYIENFYFIYNFNIYFFFLNLKLIFHHLVLKHAVLILLWINIAYHIKYTLKHLNLFLNNYIFPVFRILKEIKMLALKNLSKQTKVVSNCFKLIPRVAGNTFLLLNLLYILRNIKQIKEKEIILLHRIMESMYLLNIQNL